MPTRREMWDRLGGEFDLLVVGGGINGCGIARDAAMRGLRVALVEMQDFAFGTSSRSSKLVHGGLRYLEQYEFGLVFEAVSERRVLMDIAPHLVHPLGFLFPVYKGSRQPLWLLNAGMWLYDGLSLFRSPKIHRTLDRRQVEQVEPTLRAEDLQGAPLYYDCSTDDARLTLENAIDAARLGAVVSSHCKVVRFLTAESGELCGAVVEDDETGATVEVRALAVVNATGPWTDRTMALSASSEARAQLRPTKGVHIVVDRARLPVQHAVVCFHPEDGRVLFAVPWGDRTYVGTTDTDDPVDPSQVHATAADVDYLLEAANAYFPSQLLTTDDVLSTWAGLRPLMRPSGEVEGGQESSVSREHQILVAHDGLITIAGGKLTTYRRMSAEVVDTVVKRLKGRLSGRLRAAPTGKQPLPGGVGWPHDDEISGLLAAVSAAAGGLPDDVVAHLVEVYGVRAAQVAALVREEPASAQRLVDGRPEIVAQIDWAVREEMAAEVADFLVRRSQLFYRDAEQGLGAVPVVAARMAGLLGWSEQRRARSEEHYREVVRTARAWRGEGLQV
jgi:glycerol-3-phosphate dehydrogenase